MPVRRLAGRRGSAGVSAWHPAQYLAFAAPRLRPAQDLLARIGLAAPGLVYDLGCGAGNVTALIVARWPQATVVGVDSSPDMLARAAETLPQGRWLEADIATWAPERPADLIFSNAALHWLGDHQTLLPRLAAGLCPGGVLALQMPNNFAAPSHGAIAETAREGPWRARLEPLLRPPLAPPRAYHELLAPHCRHLDLWETEYLHLLEGPDPVLAWVKGTALRPLLAALAAPERARFEAALSARLRRAYPAAADGRTPFPFRRLFIVAQREGGAGPAP